MQVSGCCWEHETPSVRMQTCSLTPPSVQNWGKLPFIPMAGVTAPPDQGFTPNPQGKDAAVQREAAGSGLRALTRAVGPVPHWDFLGWVLVSAPGCAAAAGTRVSSQAMWEWHHPALFLHLHGDVREAMQMEICKTER